MNEVLQQIANVIERTRSVSSLSSISMIGFSVVLIFGVINCILGYRLLRFWMMLCGFAIGAGIGFGLAYSGGVTEKYMYAAIMAGTGVVLSIIAFVSYKVGVFILGAGIGIGLGIYVLHPTTSLMFFFCLLLGVGLGVLAMKKAREVLIVGTSLFGGIMAGLSAARLGGLADFPYGIGLSAGFTLLGMLIQFATNRNKLEEDEEYDEIDDEEESSSDYVDPRDYIPEKKHRKQTARRTVQQQRIRINEEALDEAVLREMMDEDERAGDELWNRIAHREEKRKAVRDGKRDKNKCNADA